MKSVSYFDVEAYSIGDLRSVLTTSLGSYDSSLITLTHLADLPDGHVEVRVSGPGEVVDYAAQALDVELDEVVHG